MWILVFINVMLTMPSGYDEPYIEAWWEFDSMEECFLARELIITQSLESLDGIPPKGTQLVCINNEKLTNEEKRNR